MKSPYTGKEMKIVYEPRTWVFRGEQYHYTHIAYRCEDTGERFTTCESDDAGFTQVANPYRVKYGIPFTDDIKSIRHRYGISATKMSSILGIGTNQWRLYENGEVPNVSNGRIIRSIMNPRVFLDLVESSRQLLTDKEYSKISAKVKEVISTEDDHTIDRYLTRRLFGNERSLNNGYAPLSLERLKNIMLYMLGACGETFCLKMDKMLFYLDFLSYRERGIAMTGLSYRAMEHGPSPERWSRVYSEFDEIQQHARLLRSSQGNALTTEAQADESCFTPEEIGLLDTVCTRFMTDSPIDIFQTSCQEDAWIDCHDQSELIPFDKAFTLKAI